MNASPLRSCLALGILCLVVTTSAWTEDPNPATIHSERGAWPLYRQWTPAEFQHYSKWVQNIFHVKSRGNPKQRLAKIEAVLNDPEMNLLLDPAFAGEPSNPQLDPASMHAMHTILDCGKLTISLGSYYAYRRGLPWMITYVRSTDGTDLRTAVKNEPVTWSSSFDYSSTHQFFVDAVTGFCTGNYRVEPTAQNAQHSDTVPVAIDPRYLVPGVMYYHDGHVLVLGNTDPYGQVYFLDATTAVSRDIYTHNTINAVTGLAPRQSSNAANPYAGCFRGFRQYRFPYAETNAEGKVTGVRRMTDEEMKAFGYSLEQYDVYEALMNGKSDQFPGKPEGIHAYIREKLRTAESIDPVAMLDSFADQIVEAFKTREGFVQAGWNEVQTQGPIPFPEGNRFQNVFNEQGRWGSFSTASLDVDYRSEYFQLMSWIDDAIDWYASRPELVNFDRLSRKGVYSQADFAYALRQEKRRIFASKSIEYTNSKGEKVTLTLQEIERRLYDLSFDPNHPPELRWGAPAGSAEAATAPEAFTPLADGTQFAALDAYKREAFYRTLIHRDTDASFLRDMFTEGFPVPTKIDEHMARYFTPGSSPPLVPVQKQHTRTAQRVSMQ
ncbi:MAG: hypothetical protein AMXMBFR84_30690 [Candidatus Hydrogenedentota bacterium]